MKTYKITCKTDPWTAQRDMKFKATPNKELDANGYPIITIESNLPLKEAKKRMIDFYNEDYETYYSNWGLIVANGRSTAGTDSDGLYNYEYDSRVYRIEEE